jgi:hypothetical protein
VHAVREAQQRAAADARERGLQALEERAAQCTGSQEAFAVLGWRQVRIGRLPVPPTARLWLWATGDFVLVSTRIYHPIYSLLLGIGWGGGLNFCQARHVLMMGTAAAGRAAARAPVWGA